jgi:hypothetical protein
MGVGGRVCGGGLSGFLGWLGRLVLGWVGWPGLDRMGLSSDDADGSVLVVLGWGRESRSRNRAIEVLQRPRRTIFRDFQFEISVCAESYPLRPIIQSIEICKYEIGTTPSVLPS